MVDDALRIKLMEKTKREAEYYRSYANFLEDYGVQLRHKVNTPKKLVNIYHERKPTPPPGSRVDDYFKTLTSAGTVDITTSNLSTSGRTRQTAEVILAAWRGYKVRLKRKENLTGSNQVGRLPKATALYASSGQTGPYNSVQRGRALLHSYNPTPGILYGGTMGSGASGYLRPLWQRF